MTSIQPIDQNQLLFQKAQTLIPGGVNSPVRAFRQVGGTPKFIERAQGAYMWDANGKQYIDYIGSWGPMILGHAHPTIVDKVAHSLKNGFSYGAPTALEIDLAEIIQSLMPSIEMVRLVSSGTEATMSALRLARGFTGRKIIIKFEGCYHGHVDSLLVKAGSGLLTLGTPNSAGVPPEFTQDTLVLTYNDAEQLQEAFEKYRGQIAAVIIEPVAGNMNLIRPSQQYHDLLRKLCSDDGAVLIFDEVMTGFRVGLTGAQGYYGIKPDLTCLGKVIGGGMPIGAFGGRKDIMSHMAPIGNVYQAGTLSGNPVAVTCGLATLEIISQNGFYQQVGLRTAQLSDGINHLAKTLNLPICADYIGTMFGIYFSQEVPTRYDSVVQSDIERFKAFFHAMLDRGIYLAPSAFEAGFVSVCHDEVVIDMTLQAAKEALKLVYGVS